MTGGEVEVTSVTPDTWTRDRELQESGADVVVGERSVRVRAPERSIPLRVTTAPYPGFDRHAGPVQALLSVASGRRAPITTPSTRKGSRTWPSSSAWAPTSASKATRRRYTACPR